MDAADYEAMRKRHLGELTHEQLVGLAWDREQVRQAIVERIGVDADFSHVELSGALDNLADEPMHSERYTLAKRELRSAMSRLPYSASMRHADYVLDAEDPVALVYNMTQWLTEYGDKLIGVGKEYDQAQRELGELTDQRDAVRAFLGL
jgi:hypothetical protein